MEKKEQKIERLKKEIKEEKILADFFEYRKCYKILLQESNLKIAKLEQELKVLEDGNKGTSD